MRKIIHIPSLQPLQGCWRPPALTWIRVFRQMFLHARDSRVAASRCWDVAPAVGTAEWQPPALCVLTGGVWAVFVLWVGAAPHSCAVGIAGCLTKLPVLGVPGEFASRRNSELLCSRVLSEAGCRNGSLCSESVSCVDLEWPHFSAQLICTLADIGLGSVDLRVME